jgi:hypothetical protein
MQPLYVIGQAKPLIVADLQKIERLVDFALPTDYKKFLADYGFGSINELLMIFQPDKEFIKSNFGDEMGHWDWTKVDEQMAINGLTIATTIDGDVLAIVDNEKEPLLLMPRHSEDILFFANFEKVIDYYDKIYGFSGDLYFDPSNNYEQKYLDFVIAGKLDKMLFEQVYQLFLENIPYDRAFNLANQPKYVIQKIGGWIYFDNIYKSSVRIKYQTPFTIEAEKVIKFIIAQIEKEKEN